MPALRLYERLGLIKPARCASGWRLYGRGELVRLNAIVALKSLGLSLAHIAEVLSSSTPALRPALPRAAQAARTRAPRA